MKKAVLILSLFGLLSAAPGFAQGFNPNFILDDAEINDYTSMSLEDIRQFLDDRGGYIRNYKANACTVSDVAFGLPCSGPLTSAAEIIYDRAITNKVNPKFLLVLLQKEQSLIEKANPSQNQLDWAVGYGCFDGLACNSRWKGFWKQLNSSSLQFRDYMDNPGSYRYQVGQTYTIYNTDNPPSIVTPLNRATCAFYNYTPHVYWGNYNFYKIWSRYFLRDYPNGTLLQVSGQPGVWLLQNGYKRAFKSRGALTSRFDTKKIVTVSKTDLDKYDTGAPISFAQYSIARSPSGNLFLLVDDTRRGFINKAAFAKFGFNPEEIINASWDELNAYREVKPLTATSTYPTGALLQDKKTGGVYWVIDGTKAPIPDRIYLTTIFKNRKIQKSTTADLAKLQTVDPVRFYDGWLIRGVTDSAVYVISDGQKKPIMSAKVFESLKYDWKNILTVPDKILYLYPDGEPLKEKNDPIAAPSLAAPATSTATSSVASVASTSTN